MRLTDAIQAIHVSLQEPLPGRDAQLKMAPAYRPDFSAADIQRMNPRQSAVLVLLFERAGETKLLFTKRAEYKGTHSGQMSFPGGKMEPDDDSFIMTALREAGEETGLNSSDVEVLGTLSELYIPPSNFVVQPVLAYAPQAPVFSKDDFEVAELVEIPLSFFLQNNRSQRARIPLLRSSEVEVPAYIYNSYIIWGATCIILSELTDVVQRGVSFIQSQSK